MSTYPHIVKAVNSLMNDVKMPKEIAEDAGIRQNHISKVLRELKEIGVAECINPEVRRADCTD